MSELEKNNNKEWFDNHRQLYDVVKENFEQFVEFILKEFSKSDADLEELSARHCIFRINRDIRFSKDKTPYKVSRSAYFSRGGKKSKFGGYYIHIQPGDKSFAGGGIWMPQTPELKKVRQEIDYCLPEFKSILSEPAFKRMYRSLEQDENNMLVNIPKGYEKENPAAEFLRMKSFVATRYFSDKEVLDKAFPKKVLLSFNALVPLIKFINRAVE